MKSNKNQTGFAGWELVLAVVVIAAIGLIGYKIYTGYNPTVKSSTTTTTNPTVSTPTAPAINNTSDLDKASAALDNNDPTSTNASDLSQLNTQSSSL